MKWDVYTRRKQDEDYEDIYNKIHQCGEIKSRWVASLSYAIAYERYNQYRDWSLSTLDDETELTSFLFAIHSSVDIVERESPYETQIFPHLSLDPDMLVLNLVTHEIRTPKVIRVDEVLLYNTDDDPSAQKYGYVRIIDEKWPRSQCVPVSKRALKEQEDSLYYTRSKLGTHPKYNTTELEDLCDW